MEFTAENIKKELVNIKKLKRKQYRIDNAEHIHEHAKQYRIDNTEHIREHAKQYKLNHAEHYKQYRKQHSQEMKDKRSVIKNRLFILSIIMDRHKEMQERIADTHRRFLLLPYKL